MAISKVNKIILQLVRYKNGVTSDSMTEHGVKYEQNFGVSIMNIMSVAKQYAPDHELAMELFARPEREAKIAAIYIADPSQLTKEQAYIISTQITNSEMAEQVAMKLMPNIPHAMVYAQEWCSAKNNEFLQKTGWMSIGRMAAKESTSQIQLENSFALIDNANFSSVHVCSALVYALPKIASKSDILKKKIEEWLALHIKSNNAQQQWVASEVSAFLTV